MFVPHESNSVLLKGYCVAVLLNDRGVGRRPLRVSGTTAPLSTVQSCLRVGGQRALMSVPNTEI